eukprot:scaffold33132_cov137-Skeletonema_menzelii.AAC.2
MAGRFLPGQALHKDAVKDQDVRSCFLSISCAGKRRHLLACGDIKEVTHTSTNTSTPEDDFINHLADSPGLISAANTPHIEL